MSKWFVEALRLLLKTHLNADKNFMNSMSEFLSWVNCNAIFIIWFVHSDWLLNWEWWAVVVEILVLILINNWVQNCESHLKSLSSIHITDMLQSVMLLKKILAYLTVIHVFFSEMNFTFFKNLQVTVMTALNSSFVLNKSTIKSAVTVWNDIEDSTTDCKTL